MPFLARIEAKDLFSVRMNLAQLMMEEGKQKSCWISEKNWNLSGQLLAAAAQSRLVAIAACCLLPLMTDKCHLDLVTCVVRSSSSSTCIQSLTQITNRFFLKVIVVVILGLQLLLHAIDPW